MRVVGYVRVSSEEQTRDGISLDVQREEVGMFARLHGLELGELVSGPGESGSPGSSP